MSIKILLCPVCRSHNVYNANTNKYKCCSCNNDLTYIEEHLEVKDNSSKIRSFFMIAFLLFVISLFTMIWTGFLKSEINSKYILNYAVKKELVKIDTTSDKIIWLDKDVEELYKKIKR